MKGRREPPSILREIAAHKRTEVEARKLRPVPAEQEPPDPPLDFAAALRRDTVSVIAECKAASPSAGVMRDGFDAVSLARAYESGGAACLSVLTDERYFKGHDNDLKRVRRATSLPILRKEFIIDRWQIPEARRLGADAILLIVAILDSSALAEFAAEAAGLGMSVLVEVHDEDELARALELKPRLLGINNRDLHRFTTDLSTTERLAPLVPEGTLIVSESGIARRVNVERVARCGARAVLVGEALVRASDPEALLRELASVPVALRRVARGARGESRVASGE